LVSDIPARDGKNDNLFLQCTSIQISLCFFFEQIHKFWAYKDVMFVSLASCLSKLFKKAYLCLTLICLIPTFSNGFASSLILAVFTKLGAKSFLLFYTYLPDKSVKIRPNRPTKASHQQELPYFANICVLIVVLLQYCSLGSDQMGREIISSAKVIRNYSKGHRGKQMKKIKW
jgi:hypothetical protein